MFAPDGQIDNGWQILNLQNPLNARDHIRQAVADTIHLTRTIGSLNFPDGDPNPDLDGSAHPLRRHLARQHHQRRLSRLEQRGRHGHAVEPGRPVDLDPHGPGGDRLRRRRSARRCRRRACRQAPSDSTTSSATCRRSSTRWIRSTTRPMPRRTHPLHVIEVLGDTAVPNDPTDFIASLWGLPSVHATVAVAPPSTTTRHRALQSGRALVVVQSRDQPGRDRRDAARRRSLSPHRSVASIQITERERRGLAEVAFMSSRTPPRAEFASSPLAQLPSRLAPPCARPRGVDRRAGGAGTRARRGRRANRRHGQLHPAAVAIRLAVAARDRDAATISRRPARTRSAT